MPLLWLSLAFLAGLIVAELISLPASAWLSLSGGALLLEALRFAWQRSGRSRPAWRWLAALPHLPLPALVLAAVLLGGAARYSAEQKAPLPGFLSYYNDQDHAWVVEGIIAEPPQVYDTFTSLVVQVERLRPEGVADFTLVEGAVLARLSPGKEWFYGDRIRLEGELATPPDEEDFSYKRYLERHGIYSQMSYARVTLLERGHGSWARRAIYAARERAWHFVRRAYPEPESSLIAGILLGIESGIPLPVKEEFRQTGTTHLIAISGFNVSIVAGVLGGLFLRALGKKRRFLAAALTAAGLLVYTILVGAEPSVVRAAIMGGLALFAGQLGRRQDGLNTLAITAAGMALPNPNLPWEVGFQLSFMATLGLILYAGPLADLFRRLAGRFLPAAWVDRLVGPVSEYVLFTLAAQLLTLPVILYHFGRFSLVAFVVNPLVLPVQPPIMILGGLAALVGLVSYPLGQALAYLAWPFAAFTIRTVEFFAGLPFPAIDLLRLDLVWVVLFYAAVFTLTFARGQVARRLANLRPAIPLAGLAILALYAWQGVAYAPDGRLHLTLLDVGGGDALLVQPPGGGTLLVDGGGRGSLLQQGLSQRLGPARQLDWLVVANPAGANLEALPSALEHYRVASALWAGPTRSSRAARNLHDALRVAGIPLTQARAGHALDLGQGARLRFLAVGESGGIVLIEWGNFRLLAPLGAEKAELECLADYPAPTVLILPTRSEQGTDLIPWIGVLQPRLVLAPGVGLPEALEEALMGRQVLRLGQAGSIHLSTDGQQLWVEAER